MKQSATNEGESSPSSLKIESGYLVINGQHKLGIEKGRVWLPEELRTGLLDTFTVDQLPKELNLRIEYRYSSDYPMNGFRFIDLCRTSEGSIKVTLVAAYSREDWEDPITVAAWKAIMIAAVTIAAEKDQSPSEISDRSTDSALIFTVTIEGKGNSIAQVWANAHGTILRIEPLARAFHFSVAQQRLGFESY